MSHNLPESFPHDQDVTQAVMVCDSLRLPQVNPLVTLQATALSFPAKKILPGRGEVFASKIWLNNHELQLSKIQQRDGRLVEAGRRARLEPVKYVSQRCDTSSLRALTTITDIHFTCCPQRSSSGAPKTCDVTAGTPRLSRLSSLNAGIT
ncbi:hypothetical protein E2C01_013146 [Portunus trituberculatus]|uniref:Uncharacterized protein n=1 Tax=Portunus trituberculatus TaxID=210409 RepID=A0A5B7DFH9_PORTR|nr:hypothetical protein [Portunus trituberculatus]